MKLLIIILFVFLCGTCFSQINGKFAYNQRGPEMGAGYKINNLELSSSYSISINNTKIPNIASFNIGYDKFLFNDNFFIMPMTGLCYHSYQYSSSYVKTMYGAEFGRVWKREDVQEVLKFYGTYWKTGNLHYAGIGFRFYL